MIDELQGSGSEHTPVSVVTRGDATSGANASGANDQLVMGLVNKLRSSKSKWISDTNKDVRCSLSV
jgi:hypothetical protein